MSTHPHLPAGGHCLRNVHRDFVEWHRGRSRYVLWAIDVNLPVVQWRIDAAKAHLDGLLLDGYVRQPHITLALRCWSVKSQHSSNHRLSRSTS